MRLYYCTTCYHMNAGASRRARATSLFTCAIFPAPKYRPENFIYFMYMSFCPQIFMCTTCVPGSVQMLILIHQFQAGTEKPVPPAHLEAIVLVDGTHLEGHDS